MDYYGMFPKFKYNRQLNADEKKHKLNQSDRTDIASSSITSDSKIISMGSNYLELVDKYYSPKGFAGLVCFPAVVVSILVFIAVLYSVIFDYGWSNVIFALPYLLLLIPCLGTFFFMIKLLKTEWFAWTHYPIRFDRRNRMVHFIRLDGTARSVPWDKVYFTSGLSHRKGFNKSYYISGHIMANDSDIIIDTFCLPVTSPDRKALECHWEFVRRYMEDGPESVVHAVKDCLPIDGKREGYHFGLIYVISAFNGMPIFLFPFIFTLSFILSIPRYIAMVTSKIPVWPESIEEQCAILENDPYAVDASINSKHPWRDMFRKQPEDE
ncbi:hypothetical protein GW590_07055 [Rahnella sp. SAP-1]|uniref:DUF6708 domain-containing protein n=1 Tax=Rouxiella aceris TaxID=2703884 RepID=A0A848MEA5_9GAMM|nr:DUF6708 domain-containing protein [Rouxiella aceris]NMP26618.1 hypothetical protein [Rouxiella aceris]